jgi:hypothetical protein
MEYTLASALEYSEKGNIEEWVHGFLLGIGKNKELSDGLKKQKRFWIGPIRIELNKLVRCCGPEEGMKYAEPI